MKKLLIAGIAALSLMPVPANAGNEGALIGGLIGGVIIGGMLSNNHHNHGPRPGYYYEEQYYVDQTTCWYEYQKVWDPYLRHYVTRRIRYCD